MLHTNTQRANSGIASTEYGVPTCSSTRRIRIASRLGQALTRAANAGRAAVRRASPARTPAQPCRSAPPHLFALVKRAFTYVIKAGSRLVHRVQSDAPAQRPRPASPVVARTYKIVKTRTPRAVTVDAAAGSSLQCASGTPDVPRTGVAHFSVQPARVVVEQPAPLPAKSGPRRSTSQADVIGKIDMRHRPLPLTPTQIAFEQMIQPLREAYDKAQAQACDSAQAQPASPHYVNEKPTPAPGYSNVGPAPAPRYINVAPTPAPRYINVKPTPAPRYINLKPTSAPRLGVKPSRN